MDEDLENKISQIVGALKGQFSSGDSGGSGNSESGGGGNSGNSGFDMSDDTLKMMMKMKGMFDKQNKQSDPAKDLLIAIKPFLKDSRQERVGNCIKLLGMTKMAQFSEFFKDK